MAVLSDTTKLLDQLKASHLCFVVLLCLPPLLAQYVLNTTVVVQGAVSKNDLSTATRILNTLKVIVVGSRSLSFIQRFFILYLND